MTFFHCVFCEYKEHGIVEKTHYGASAVLFSANSQISAKPQQPRARESDSFYRHKFLQCYLYFFPDIKHEWGILNCSFLLIFKCLIPLLCV